MSARARQTFVGLAWKCRKARPWLFDMEAIRQAATELGIKAPVMVGIVEAGGRTRTTFGAHRVKTRPHLRLPDGVVHEWHHGITVMRTCSMEQASKTLWHELMHAVQAEREDDPTRFYDTRYRPENWSGYKTNPFEVEARECERNAERLALVKEVGS